MEGFHELVAVELFVVGVGDCIKEGFILWEEDGFCIASEVRACHGDDMCFVSCDEFADLISDFVIRVCTCMVEFVDGDEAIIEGFDAETIDSKAEGCVGADKDIILAIEEVMDSFDFSVGLFFCVIVFVFVGCVA